MFGCVVLLSVVFSTISAQLATFANGWSWLVVAAAVGGSPTRSERSAAQRARSANVRFRILIYARYSTEEQDASSITDQVAFCRRYLADRGIVGDIEVIADPEMSGETVCRPGLNKLQVGVASHLWNMIISEDSSRLFRLPTHCCVLVETAVDAGIRVICINDDVDTAKDSWGERLHEAQQHHAKANRYTRQRIARKLDGLWRMGAATTQVRTGYARVPTVPARTGERAKGPFFDHKDPTWEPVVYEAFERIGDGELPWVTGRWLTEKKLPGCNKARVWSEKNVIALIRQEVYRGVEFRKKTTTTRTLRTRKKTVKRNPVEEMESRVMEHLRIVPDWLWYKANCAIDARNRRPDCPTGRDNELHGIPRASRGPLSNLFVCFCGEKMWVDGRNEGSYRCSGAKRGRCWCRCTALRSITHCAISRAVVNKLLSFSGSLEAILEFTSELAQSEGHMQQREAELNALALEARRKRDRLLAAIESSDEDVVQLATLLGQRNRELDQIQCSIEELRTTSENCRPRSVDEIRARIEQCCGELLGADPSVGSLLGHLVDGKIIAVPYQQFGSNRVVLRAEFRLRLAMFLPASLLAALRGAVPEVEGLENMDMIVDLFEPILVPRHALAAVEAQGVDDARTDRPGIRISKPQAYRASQLGAKMIEAGITDPYIRLTEPPQTGSRWKVHPKFRSASGLIEAEVAT